MSIARHQFHSDEEYTKALKDMSDHPSEPWKVLAKMIAKDFNLMEDAVQNQINVWIEKRGLQGINPEAVPLMVEALKEIDRWIDDKSFQIEGGVTALRGYIIETLAKAKAQS